MLGFLFRFDPKTLVQLGILNLSPDGEGASIWQSGQGPAAADAFGNIYFITSNGTWDGRRNLADSFVKLAPDLRVLDWFTPTDYKVLNGKLSATMTSTPRAPC